MPRNKHTRLYSTGVPMALWPRGLVIVATLIMMTEAINELPKEDYKDSDQSEFCSKETCGPGTVRLDYNQDIVFSHMTSQPIRISTPSVLKNTEGSDCSILQDDVVLCREWSRYGKVEIREVNGGTGLTCHQVTWLSTSGDFAPTDCVSMTHAHWFGGAEFHNQSWPLNGIEIPMQPFASQDLYTQLQSFGNVLEPFWINSNGLGLWVNDASPLHVSINDDKSNALCLRSDFSQRYFPRKKLNHLEYTICKGKNILEVYQSMSKVAFAFPNGIPDLRMMKRPIWSTWARYKTLINQSKVLQYAREITDFGFPNSQLQIDDMYTTAYGDFDFDPEKFPDPTGMVQTLKDQGYRVTAWIHPFANLDSNAFYEGLKHGYWVMDSGRQVPALVKWWQGVAAILDVTNPEAADWFIDRLKSVQQKYGIDSFKFDAGEMTYLPSSYQTFKQLKNPGYFTKAYVDITSRINDMVEVRCGYKSQNHQVFVRMADKDSTWGYNNGLKSLIPASLTLGLLGYPYILPDMIGGNGYGEEIGVDVVLPERELYIRWLQLTAYLPAMQFSFVPWDYDDEVVNIALEMVRIHEDIISPILIKAAEETQITGTPLIRPLWWTAPDDQAALTIDSEFLVGTNLLVAPILDNGKRHRDIYLPNGRWKDNLTGETVEGGKWLKNYNIELKDIATFTRLTV